MGKSVPTFRQELKRIESEWRRYRKALRREEKRAFDELFIKAMKHASASQYQAASDPMEAFFISVLLEQQKKIERLERVVKDEGLDLGYLSEPEQEEDSDLDQD
ncbi:MAG: hypothetical protein ACOC55_04910 [Candidatus Natronoplasma sp.]